MHSKRSKMVLCVGDEEAAELEERYHENGFGDLFPKLREIGREEIAELESKVVEGRDPDTELKALQTPDGYVVDYGAVAKSFVDAAREEEGVAALIAVATDPVRERDPAFPAARAGSPTGAGRRRPQPNRRRRPARSPRRAPGGRPLEKLLGEM